ncbi:Exopolygalacturonase [Hortaea werneckii]|nr:Exopolygalacturonase [Hortaea werneckii]
MQLKTTLAALLSLSLGHIPQSTMARDLILASNRRNLLGSGLSLPSGASTATSRCNDGGHVIFPQGTTYVIGQALNLTYLKHIDLDIQGYIQFTNDTDYWQDNAFYQVYQNATTFFQIGGEDVNIYGGGMLDGNGQVWYDLYAEDIYILRPILFGTVGLHGGSISDLYLRYSPQWYNFLANSTDVVFDNFNIRGYSASENEAKNTDGWDTYRSSNIVIQNSVVNNGDDCVSFKPNSTEVLVQNMYCNGSHGISVGSIGQYPGEVDIVENLYVSSQSTTSPCTTHRTEPASKSGPAPPPHSPATSKAAVVPAASATSPTKTCSSTKSTTPYRSPSATARTTSPCATSSRPASPFPTSTSRTSTVPRPTRMTLSAATSSAATRMFAPTSPSRTLRSWLLVVLRTCLLVMRLTKVCCTALIAPLWTRTTIILFNRFAATFDPALRLISKLFSARKLSNTIIRQSHNRSFATALNEIISCLLLDAILPRSASSQPASISRITGRNLEFPGRDQGLFDNGPEIMVGGVKTISKRRASEYGDLPRYLPYRIASAAD